MLWQLKKDSEGDKENKIETKSKGEMARKEERKGDTETKKDINDSNTGRWKHTKNRCMAEGGCWVKEENTKNRGWV